MFLMIFSKDVIRYYWELKCFITSAILDQKQFDKVEKKEQAAALIKAIHHEVNHLFSILRNSFYLSSGATKG